jgi:hypothetical protein
LRDLFAHFLAKEPDFTAAYDRLVNEIGFTNLNRLVALRLAEERGYVVECVRKGMDSEGFRIYQLIVEDQLGTTFETYRFFLKLIYDEMAVDLHSLFDRDLPQGLVIPSEPVLRKVLSDFNAVDLVPLWKEDETIGWIYQYYNDPAERKAMREASSAPRNSRELAVRNQFFTPRYVVEFLTDNTLGRTWYEMTKGATTLREQCRYLVRRPNEIFLQPAEIAPEQPKQDNLSQEDLLMQPVHIPHRPLKDPRTILMLDPACGSMHFGLYAFDLFEVIYDEAWELEENLGVDSLSRPEGVKSLHETFADRQAFLNAVPKLIIEYNIHGVDIDPRATQIAGLALWLRAQRSWRDMGLAPTKRPIVKRSNIVCAEPMPGEKELLREFVEREFPPEQRAICQRLLEAIFDKMQLAGEAGSLLKIEEEIRGAIEEARDAWQKLAAKPGVLFTTTELNQISTAPETTGLEQAVSFLTTDPRHLTTDFWERIEERIYAALSDYAEQAEIGGGFQRRLFAEDASRGFAFIDVCRKRYDVAVMNPPFGDPSLNLSDLMERKFPRSRFDLSSAFVDSSSGLLNSTGKIGAITTRSLFFLVRYEDFRSYRLFGANPVSHFLDLGHGVLDAMINTAAVILDTREQELVWCADLKDREPKDELIQQAVDFRRRVDFRFLRMTEHFRKLPGHPLSYWCSAKVVSMLKPSGSLESNNVSPCVGLQTNDDSRFMRLRWEVLANSIGRSATWVFVAKGGEYSKFWDDIHLVVKWQSEGAEVKDVIAHEFGSASKHVRNESSYFRAGLTYPFRTNKGFNIRILPAECIFTLQGMGVFVRGDSSSELLKLLGLMNTHLYLYCLRLVTSSDAFQAGYVAKLPYYPDDPAMIAKIEGACRIGLDSRRELDRFDETTCLFLCPAMAKKTLPTLQSDRLLAEPAQRAVVYNLESLFSSVETLNELTSTLFSLPPEDREEVRSSVTEPEVAIAVANAANLWQATVGYFLGCAFGRWDIRYATGEQAAPELPDPFAPLPVCPPGQLQNAQGLPARPDDVPESYPVRIPWEGILVDDPNHPLDIERRVREVIKLIWTGEGAGTTPDAIEQEACEILGVKSLRDYFRKPAGFFADHLKRYSKSRRQAPIYWPLSTASGSYTLWIYYHRLDEQTLYRAVENFVRPKLALVERERDALEVKLRDNSLAPAKERDSLTQLRTFAQELIDLRDELLRVAALPYRPDLNDGVVINAAPLRNLFRLKPWVKTLDEVWKKLEKGDYDWAHMALHLWPDRVRAKCVKDRSLAIAHDLESICTAPDPSKNKSEKSKGKKREAALIDEETELTASINGGPV